jgi:hypothetical protein
MQEEATPYQKKAEMIFSDVLAHFLTNHAGFGRLLGDAKDELHRDDFEILQELIKIMPNFDCANAASLVASFALELIELRKSIPMYEGQNCLTRPRKLTEFLMQNKFQENKE